MDTHPPVVSSLRLQKHVAGKRRPLGLRWKKKKKEPLNSSVAITPRTMRSTMTTKARKVKERDGRDVIQAQKLHRVLRCSTPTKCILPKGKNYVTPEGWTFPIVVNISDVASFHSIYCLRFLIIPPRTRKLLSWIQCAFFCRHVYKRCATRRWGRLVIP